MSFKFTLRFDNKAHSLSRDFGLPINDLGELLLALYPVIKTRDGENITLSEVRGNCYAIDFQTDEEETRDRFLKIHKKIVEGDIEALKPEENQYIQKLEKTVIKRELYVEALDPEHKETATRIEAIPVIDKIDSYYSTKTLYGIISEIGGPKLDSKPHILVSGEPYKIWLTPEQEDRLRPFHKKGKLLLKIRVKYSLKDKKIWQAELVDFKDLGDKRLDERFEDLNENDLSFLVNINTEEIIKKLRNRE